MSGDNLGCHNSGRRCSHLVGGGQGCHSDPPGRSPPPPKAEPAPEGSGAEAKKPCGKVTERPSLTRTVHDVRNMPQTRSPSLSHLCNREVGVRRPREPVPGHHYLQLGS